MATNVNSNASFNGLSSYLRIFTTTPSWQGPAVKGSTIAIGAYYAWAINNAPVAAQYPGGAAPGSGFSTKLDLMGLRWGLRRGMVPIAGSGV